MTTEVAGTRWGSVYHMYVHFVGKKSHTNPVEHVCVLLGTGHAAKSLQCGLYVVNICTWLACKAWKTRVAMRLMTGRLP